MPGGGGRGGHHEAHEAPDAVGLIELPQHGQVGAVGIESHRDEAVEGVDGRHPEDADDVLLHSRRAVVDEVLADLAAGERDGHEGERRREEPRHVVRAHVQHEEGQICGQRRLRRCETAGRSSAHSQTT